MPAFVWEGTTRGGENRKGEMKAADQQEVDRRLRAQNIDPSKIKKKGIEIKLGGSRVPMRNLVIFTRQFATMIDAGLPIVQCLELLGEAEPHKGFSEIQAAVKADVEAGSTLADAMSRHKGAFSNLYTALVSAGEEAGILDLSLIHI